MTLKSFFLITFLQWACLSLLRFFYFRGNLGTGESGYYFYFFLVAFATLILVRRLGVMSFFEAIFVCLFWFGFNLFFDLIISSAFLGTIIFRAWEFWTGYFVSLGVVFLLHKKRHVHIRKQLHAKHH